MHSEYEIRLLAEQRSSKLIAESERLNRLHDRRRRPQRKYLGSLLASFRRPGTGTDTSEHYRDVVTERR